MISKIGVFSNPSVFKKAASLRQISNTKAINSMEDALKCVGKTVDDLVVLETKGLYKPAKHISILDGTSYAKMLQK